MKYARFGLILVGVMFILSCRKEPEIPEPATPKGLSYQIQDGSILFSWFPAEDALSYGIEVGTDAELADLVLTKEGIADTFQLVSCDSFEFDSTFHWRVRAEGEAGWGDWSNVASFFYEEPDVPTLVSPEDGAVFDTLPPTFVWSFVWSEESFREYYPPIYYLFVFKDSLWSKDTLVYCQSLYFVTTFTLSMNDFVSAARGTYAWTVAVKDSTTGELIYPKPRTFHIKEPSLQPFDLDTTYFPFGLGYEWCYEKHNYGESNFGSHRWDYYDTTRITVVDSSSQGGYIIVNLNKPFKDCLDSTIIISAYNLMVFYDFPINLCNPQPAEYTNIDTTDYEYAEIDTYIRSYYTSDTLCLSKSLAKYIYRGGLCITGNWETKRLKGIGPIYQRYSSVYNGHSNDQTYCTYRLLYFYNGQDTVYYASQSEAFGSSAKSCAARYRTSQAD